MCLCGFEIQDIYYKKHFFYFSDHKKFSHIIFSMSKEMTNKELFLHINKIDRHVVVSNLIVGLLSISRNNKQEN